MCDLLLSFNPENNNKDDNKDEDQINKEKMEKLHKLSFAQLRDELLDIAPLDIEHVKAVNTAGKSSERRSGPDSGPYLSLL